LVETAARQGARAVPVVARAESLVFVLTAGTRPDKLVRISAESAERIHADNGVVIERFRGATPERFASFALWYEAKDFSGLLWQCYRGPRSMRSPT
jgi:hypothetical protein